jgi:hypothetical protein
MYSGLAGMVSRIAWMCPLPFAALFIAHSLPSELER